MSVEKFVDRDDDYLSWVEAHPTGYVINVGRSGGGYARLHHAACKFVRSRPSFTRTWIKICSTSIGDLDHWALDHRGSVAERCGTCQPPGHVAIGQDAAPSKSSGAAPASVADESFMAAGHEWEIDGPSDGQRWVRLWSNRYIPFERLTSDQRKAREELKRRARSLSAGVDEILDASYAGSKPANTDVENLLLYNIDARAGGCFNAGARHGLRFEVAPAMHGNPPSGRPYACSYQYQLTSPDTPLSYWRPVRRLAGFTDAGLGRFPASKRLEQVWLAIHDAERDVDGQATGQAVALTESFAVFLTLSHPDTKSTGAHPELVKALIDGTVAAFQVHSNRASVDELAARLAAITRRPTELIKQTLLDDSHAVLGADSLVRLRGPAGVQWNPADHLCVAGQIVCQPTPENTWKLSGEIHAVEQARYAGCGS